MKLKVLGSNSDGNCYILEADSGEILILDAGLTFSKIKIGLNFDLSNVIGILLTHEHGDHSKGVKEALKSGIKVYSSNGTFEALGINHHNAIVLPTGTQSTIGSFSVIPIAAVHDVKEPINFIFHHKECGKCIYLTDTIFCKYNVPGLNNILIEANHDIDIIRKKVSGAELNRALGDRVIKSHMSIETAIKTLKMFNGDDVLNNSLGNLLGRVNNIVLVHLSNGNSNAAEFQNRVQKLIPQATVSVADAGLVLENFNIDKF